MKSMFPFEGTVEWIGVRPSRGVVVKPVARVDVSIEEGIVGDRFCGPAGAKRQVTLIQAEHLEVVAKLLQRTSVDPALLRRNIVVRGLNLVPLKGAIFEIGSCRLLGTGPCAPCSKMESQLGAGGFNATRGHGGITASVIEGGEIAIGDAVRFEMLNE